MSSDARGTSRLLLIKVNCDSWTFLFATTPDLNLISNPWKILSLNESVFVSWGRQVLKEIPFGPEFVSLSWVSLSSNSSNSFIFSWFRNWLRFLLHHNFLWAHIDSFSVKQIPLLEFCLFSWSCVRSHWAASSLLLYNVHINVWRRFATVWVIRPLRSILLMNVWSLICIEHESFALRVL